MVKNVTQILPCLIWKILCHTGNKRKTDQVTENKQENKEKKGEREREREREEDKRALWRDSSKKKIAFF